FLSFYLVSLLSNRIAMPILANQKFERVAPGPQLAGAPHAVRIYDRVKRAQRASRRFRRRRGCPSSVWTWPRRTAMRRVTAPALARDACVRVTELASTPGATRIAILRPRMLPSPGGR